MRITRRLAVLAMTWLVWSARSQALADVFATKDEAVALVKRAIARVAERVAARRLTERCGIGASIRIF